jgi:hypothetical protein
MILVFHYTQGVKLSGNLTQQEGFYYSSFPTIAGVGSIGAFIHAFIALTL